MAKFSILEPNFDRNDTYTSKIYEETHSCIDWGERVWRFAWPDRIALQKSISAFWLLIIRVRRTKRSWQTQFSHDEILMIKTIIYICSLYSSFTFLQKKSCKWKKLPCKFCLSIVTSSFLVGQSPATFGTICS